jgi:hypothetical protein
VEVYVTSASKDVRKLGTLQKGDIVMLLEQTDSDGVFVRCLTAFGTGFVIFGTLELV